MERKKRLVKKFNVKAKHIIKLIYFEFLFIIFKG